MKTYAVLKYLSAYSSSIDKIDKTTPVFFPLPLPLKISDPRAQLQRDTAQRNKSKDEEFH